MNKNLTTPFGQLNGEIMHVNAVPFELRKSEFVCSCCSSRLQIIEKHERGTSVVSAHFRHVDKERECNPESVAHAYWKQQIVDRVGKTMKFSELGECEVLQAEKEVTLGFKTGFTNKLNETVRVDCLQLVKDADGNEHTVAIEVNISNKKKEREIEIFQRLGIKVYELTVNSKENKMVGFENLNKFNAWKETQRKNELQVSESEIEVTNLKHEIEDLAKKIKRKKEEVERDNREILEELKEDVVASTKRRIFYLEELEKELRDKIDKGSRDFDLLVKEKSKQEVDALQRRVNDLQTKIAHTRTKYENEKLAYSKLLKENTENLEDDTTKALIEKKAKLERECASLKEFVETSKTKIGNLDKKKILERASELERRNHVLKDSLDFIHEKYPFLWNEIDQEEKERKFYLQIGGKPCTQN